MAEVNAFRGALPPTKKNKRKKKKRMSLGTLSFEEVGRNDPFLQASFLQKKEGGWE